MRMILAVIWLWMVTTTIGLICLKNDSYKIGSEFHSATTNLNARIDYLQWQVDGLKETSPKDLSYLNLIKTNQVAWGFDYLITNGIKTKEDQ